MNLTKPKTGGGSGYASYDIDCKQTHLVPVIEATAESLQGYARVVTDYNSEQVIIEQWPKYSQTGKNRPVMKNTGRGGGITEGLFSFRHESGYIKAENEAVGGKYIVGKFDRDCNFILTREANYHPDGGQVVYPLDSKPYILLLAKPGDDIRLEDFIAFKCQGIGVQILPNVWHQPVLPFEETAVFKNKQGAVHACVGVDTIDEFGKWLKIPFYDPRKNLSRIIGMYNPFKQA